MTKSSLKIIVGILKLAISIVLIYYLVGSVSENQSILESLKSAKLEWVAYAIILMIPNIMLQSSKWWLLLRLVDPKITFWSAIGSTLGGLSLGFLTPGRIGEIAKGLFIRHIDRLKITGLAFIDRIFNMLGISAVGLLAITYFLNFKYDLPTMVYAPPVILAFMLMAAMIYLFLHPRYLKAFYANFERFDQIRSRFRQFFSSVKDLKKRTVAQVFLLTICIQCVVAIQFIFMIFAFVDPFSVFEGFVAAFSTAFTKAILPISIADIGVRETAADLYFGFFVENRAGILNGSILLFFVNVLFPALCGLVMLPKLNFQKDLS